MLIRESPTTLDCRLLATMPPCLHDLLDVSSWKRCPLPEVGRVKGAVDVLTLFAGVSRITVVIFVVLGRILETSRASFGESII